MIDQGEIIVWYDLNTWIESQNYFCKNCVGILRPPKLSVVENEALHRWLGVDDDKSGVNCWKNVETIILPCSRSRKTRQNDVIDN
jgi:hypothetical protein